MKVLTMPVPGLSGNPRLFFTADTHFGHANVIRHCQRPFSDVHHMNQELVRRWNETVGPGDIVWHLGDFCWRNSKSCAARYLEQLNGEVHLIRGNHDGTIKDDGPFKSVHDLVQLVVGTFKIILCHYSLRSWPSKHWGAWHLFGHSHGLLQVPAEERTMDVGVDCRSLFRPLSFDEVRSVMISKPAPKGASGIPSRIFPTPVET